MGSEVGCPDSDLAPWLTCCGRGGTDTSLCVCLHGENRAARAPTMRVREAARGQRPGKSTGVSYRLILIITVIATDLFVMTGLTGQPQPADSGGGAGHGRQSLSACSAQPCRQRGVWGGFCCHYAHTAQPWPSPSLHIQPCPVPAASPHTMKPPSAVPRSPLLPRSHSFPTCRESLPPRGAGGPAGQLHVPTAPGPTGSKAPGKTGGPGANRCSSSSRGLANTQTLG